LPSRRFSGLATSQLATMTKIRQFECTWIYCVRRLGLQIRIANLDQFSAYDVADSMWFDNWSDLWRILAITITTYAVLVLILRGAGKRSLSKLNIFDLVVTVALGSTLATIMLSKDVTFAEGALAFAVLCGLQWSVAWLSLRSDWFKRMIRSEPRMLFDNGRFLDRAMSDERILRQEIDAEIRNHGFGDRESIAAVVLETDGTFSVIAKENATTCSAMEGVKSDRGDCRQNPEPTH